MFKKCMSTLLGIAILFSVFIYNIQAGGEIHTNKELNNLLKIANNQNIVIDEVKIYVKKPTTEEKTYEEVLKGIADLQKREKDFKWTVLPMENGHYKVSATKSNDSQTLKETIIVSFFKSAGGYSVNQTYQLIIKEWNKDTLNSLDTDFIKNTKSDKLYYSLTGSKRIENDLAEEARLVLSDVNAKSMEVSKEEDFLSVSALSKQFYEKIPLGEGKYMNFHLGIRQSVKNSELATFTLATPIITTEY
ncbi:YwmB family TATA-box binding protein [Metabacillus idriensis]|uniref:YwmB family TATA-box binding protein n=1 Tax=Metabacillus idriensis TaxID=324768 RepID=UPI001749201D|nr:YwmB family TATA-box binding protein [Metabacillus idriensis]